MENLFILAVSGSQETKEKLKKLLESIETTQYTCVGNNNDEVKRACQRKAPDIVIVDLISHHEDGLKLISEFNTLVADTPCLVFALYDKLDPETMMSALKHGVKEFIHYEEDSAALAMAIQKHILLYKRFNTQLPQKAKGKMISVFSPKGGSGSSTVAFNVAYEIRQQQGESVVFFEPDQAYSNIKMLLNMQPEFCLGDLSKYQPNEVDEQILQRLIVNHELQLDFLVSCKNVMDDNEIIPIRLMSMALDYLLDKYQYVIVDLPSHALDAYHQLVAERSDVVLLVSDMEVPSLYRTMQYLELAKNYLDVERLKLVLNRSDLQGAYGLSNKKLENQFEYPIYARLPDDWSLNLQANSLGCPLGKVDDNTSLVKEIRKLAKQITGTPVTESKSYKDGLFSKLAGFKLQTNLNVLTKETPSNAFN